MSKGTIRFVANSSVGLPIYEITTPKWRRRKFGRYLRKYARDRHYIRELRPFYKTEVIVGYEKGEGCTYYEGLSAIRENRRELWTEIEAYCEEFRTEDNV